MSVTPYCIFSEIPQAADCCEEITSESSPAISDDNSLSDDPIREGEVKAQILYILSFSLIQNSLQNCVLMTWVH